MMITGDYRRPPSRVPPICPNCDIVLGGWAWESQPLHRCGQCGGMWLDDELLSALLVAQDSSVRQMLGEQRPGEHTYNRSQTSRTCPSCEEPMDNYQFNYSSGIWLDSCSQGHGVWLDSGELGLLRACRRELDGPMSADDRYKMSQALLDGATTTRGNLAKIQRQVQRDYEARHLDYRSYQPPL